MNIEHGRMLSRFLSQEYFRINEIPGRRVTEGDRQQAVMLEKYIVFVESAIDHFLGITKMVEKGGCHD